ncbi:MAG: hypothetical protein N2Z80_01170 [Hydrogenothermaceae bacterium]|nr:hypothetical protein [Hydrogenothermaceae bacterium]
MVGDSFISTTVSIGISFNKSCKTYNQVFEESVTTLAESKLKGKNALTFHDFRLQEKSDGY